MLKDFSASRVKYLDMFTKTTNAKQGNNKLELVTRDNGCTAC